MGSSRLVAFNLHLHKYFNFIETTLETVKEWLLHSCRPPIKRQRILLPLDRYSYNRRLQVFIKNAFTFLINIIAPDRSQTLFNINRFCKVLIFY